MQVATFLTLVALLLSKQPQGASARPLFATPPPLGTATGFAVLGATTVTNTGPTLITGDLGVSPGTAVTGFPPGLVNGAIHAADAAAAQAQADVTAAYNNLAGQACDFDLTGQNLGGLTLIPGVYCFSSSAFLTGILTLNGQGDPNAVFVFKMGSTLITAPNSSVVPTNGTNTCNVFWQVGSSATLDTGTSFIGSILALTSITFNTGAGLTGRALARNGAVTLDSNTITAGCAVAVPTPTATPINTPIAPPINTPIAPPINTPIAPPINTPIAPPINTPIAPPINTPIAPPINTPIAPPINTPIAPPINTPIAPPINTPIAPPINTPIAPPINTPIAPPINTPVAPPINTPIAPPINTPVAPPINTPIAPPINTPIAPPINTPIAPPINTPIVTPINTPVAPPINTPTPTNTPTATPIRKNPSVITLKSFTAIEQSGGVWVRWETGSEINTFGFALYRSETSDRSDALLITGALIPSKSINDGGGSYQFIDLTAVSGRAYHYWLQEVETTGRVHDHGPARSNGQSQAALHPLKLFLPLLSHP